MFSMMGQLSSETTEISVKDLFVHNRQRLTAKIREETSNNSSSSTSSTTTGCVIYLRGGPSEERYDSDHEPIFRQVSCLPACLHA